ncbi:MAG: T9SS C-terminal target domain-containing protein [Chitinophagia bacterium]|nr:T9SS C-terminal target domain-containing protein [Chitinophagia bacterium]
MTAVYLPKILIRIFMKKLFLAAIILIAAYNANAAVNQIRWGTTGDPFNGLTITWSNTGSTDSIAWGYTTSLERGNYAGVRRTGYSTAGFFAYRFPTVLPDTTIYYKIWNSATSSWEAQKTYHTAPNPAAKKFSFAALGDCRSSPSILTSVSDFVTARRPALCLFNGDLTQTGVSASEYNTFFSAASNFLEQNLVLHAEGNHDATSPVTFSNLWNLPITNGTNLYYAVRYGNAFFVTINSCDPTNSAMRTWLHDTLTAAAADSTITWKVVSFHHPFFNVGSHQGDMDAYRTSIWKEFDDHGVDMVLNGHDHNYQRSKPINLNVSTSAPVANFGSGPGEGRLQIISGGAGASLYARGSSADAWAINIFNSTYNYVYCNVDGCTAKITAYNSSNSVIDTVTLNKTGSAGCRTVSAVNTSYKTTFNPLTIYPNPATSSFTLEYGATATGDAIITITDEKGKVVSTQKVNKSSAMLKHTQDVSKLAKGIYNVSIILADHRDSGILIVH